MTSINKVLETFMQLDYNSREMLLEILKSRQVEYEREVIASNVRKSKSAFKKGKLKAQSASELINDLNTLLKNEKA